MNHWMEDAVVGDDDEQIESTGGTKVLAGGGPVLLIQVLHFAYNSPVQLCAYIAGNSVANTFWF